MSDRVQILEIPHIKILCASIRTRRLEPH